MSWFDQGTIDGLGNLGRLFLRTGNDMEVPHYEPTGNGDEITDTVFVGPDGRITFGHAYSGRQIRLRHGAEKDAMLSLGVCRVTIEQLSEGDL